jgi:hypothetical protein
VLLTVKDCAAPTVVQVLSVSAAPFDRSALAGAI